MLGVAWGEGAVLAEHRRSTPRGADAVVHAVVETVMSLEAALAPALPGGAGQSVGAGPLPIGIGMPGLVDLEGVLRFAPHLPGVVDLAVAPSVAAALDGLAATAGARSIRVENDATCAMAGEAALGAAVGAGDAVLVTLGTGIGAGLLIGGALARGSHGMAGELGHVVVDVDGPPCPCGRRGCWEGYAGSAGLARLTLQAARDGHLPDLVAEAGGRAEGVAPEQVTAAARAGHQGAVPVVAAWARWVALGLANLTTALDPEVIVVGGGLAGAGELLLRPVRAEMAAMLMGARALGPGHRAAPAVVAAGLGERAGAVGAALLALEAGGALEAGNAPGGRRPLH